MSDQYFYWSLIFFKGEHLVKHRFFPKTLIHKLIFSLLILVIYLIGRELPLFAVDVSAYKDTSASSNLLLQTIGGDQYRLSLFALGISPYMFSSLIVQIFLSFRNSDTKSRISPKKTVKLTLVIMFVWAIIQAFIQIQSTAYSVTGEQLIWAQTISGIQMVTGSFVILWLVTRNAKYGVGGQSIIIVTNIIDSLIAVGKDIPRSEYCFVGAICVVAMLFTLIMENSEFRIPMQRISIHNIYSDKNYIAIKLNPIGMMPVMFSSAFFMIPMYICIGLIMWFPDNELIVSFAQDMQLDKPIGIITYIIILFVLSIVFSIVMVSPSSIAENLSKSGDSILGLRAGKNTKRYVMKVVVILAVFSSIVMGIIIGAPLVLHLMGYISNTAISVPTMVMALTGICCNLDRELIVVRDYDAYVPFL